MGNFQKRSWDRQLKTKLPAIKTLEVKEIVTDDKGNELVILAGHATKTVYAIALFNDEMHIAGSTKSYEHALEKLGIHDVTAEYVFNKLTK